LDQIESHILDRREVGGNVIGADAAFVVTKGSYLSPSVRCFDRQWLRMTGLSWITTHASPRYYLGILWSTPCISRATRRVPQTPLVVFVVAAEGSPGFTPIPAPY
jgi:hypothetical protein